MSDSFIREPTPHELDPGIKPGMTVIVADEGDNTRIDEKTGALEIELPDGGLAIYPNGLPPKERPSGSDHEANLADDLEEGELYRIAEELLTGIDSDIQSRSGWVEARAKGIGLLALKVEMPRSVAADGGAMEGVSTVRSPLLLEALLRFCANAGAELLPTTGPVKVRNDTPPKTRKQELLATAAAQASGVPTEPDEADTLGECLERDMNHYFTVKDKEYYADFRRMLFYTGLGGSGFRKVYRCPLKQRPVSRAIDAEDLIVADPEVSLHDAGRVTHQILMRQSVLKRMQLAGQYRNVPLIPPTQTEESAVELKESEVTGIDPVNVLPSDYKHTIYECYCELDIRGYEHKEGKEITGLPLPYRVTIDKESRIILEIRRNWKEGDDRYQARMPIVKYPFVEGLSFYGIGLLQILGNATAAVTAAWRLALDSGMMASYPAFLYSDAVSRQNTNVLQLRPGGGTKINTGGAPIQDSIMPAPYHDATAGLIGIMQHIETQASRVGGTPELAVGEGRQDAPVGTTLALLDQATKIMAAVHKGLHDAQGEEFLLFKDLFREDPDALVSGNKHPARQWRKEELIEALDNSNLVPQADPNTPSHMIRVMRAVALIQFYQMNPAAWNYREVVKRVAKMVGENDVEALFAPPAPPQGGLDPKMVEGLFKLQLEEKKAALSAEKLQLEAQLKRQELQGKMLAQQQSSMDKAKDRLSRERIELIRQETARLDLMQSALVHAPNIPGVEDFAGSPKRTN